MLENERTFLVRRLPEDLYLYPSEGILQGYITHEDAPSSVLRVRQKGQSFELTRKSLVSPGDYGCYEEQTISITEQEFKQIWPCVLRSLRKRRYYYPLPNNLTAQIDVFEGELKGLRLVEVEFPDRRDRQSFEPPEWFGADVTDREWALGVFLAGKSFAQILPFLNSVR